MGIACTLRPLAFSITVRSGPRFTTTLFSTTRLFTIRVLLMTTVVLDWGTTQVRTRRERKLPVGTKVKGTADDLPERKDTPTEKPGATGAQPM